MKLELTNKKQISAELGDVIVTPTKSLLIIKHSISRHRPRTASELSGGYEMIIKGENSKDFYLTLNLETNEIEGLALSSIERLVKRTPNVIKIIKSNDLTLSLKNDFNQDGYKNWF